MIKERRKPKQGEDNEKQNDKSVTEPDCTRIEDKESGQEIKQQNQKSHVWEHHEHKLPAQKYESEKAVREKRRIREIRAFWERDKTIPSHREKEVGINTNASGGGALKGLRESDKIKPTTEHLPYGLDDQSENTLRSAELRCANVASKNECQNSSEFGRGCEVRKPEGTLPADGEIQEATTLAKASNIKRRISATSASPEIIKDKDGKETSKGKVGACSQQKPSFQVFTLKEKTNEKSKNQISNPSQFQSLRNFWDAGVKLQSSLNRGDVSLPNNTVHNNTSITHERKSKEDKGRDNVNKQVLIQHQTQASEREKTEKLDSVIRELPLGSLTLKGLKVTHTQNTDSVQPVKKPVISQPQEQMGLQEHEVKEHIEKSIVSSKEHPLRGSQKMQAGLQNLLRETSVCQPPELRVGMKASETINNISQTNCTGESICQQDTSQSEEVNETAERSVAPSKVSGLSSALEKLMKEASETPPPKPRRVDRTLQRTAEMQVKSVTYQHNGASVQDKTGETTETSALSKAEYKQLHVNLQKLLKEVYETPGPMLENMDEKMQGKTSSRQSMCPPSREERDHPREVEETIEKTSVSNTAKFRDFSSLLERLLQEASEASSPVSREVHKQEKSRDRMFPLQKESLFTTTSQPYHNALTTYHTQMKTTIKSGAPEQNIEASVDIEASDLLKRNGALNQKEQRNMPAIDLPLEGEANTAVNRPFKVNALGRTDESTSLDASENNLELKELLQMRRTSTSLKDESNSPQPGGARLCLAFQHEDNDEEDGDSSNLGSRFSDENSDSGTGSSTRSEEDLNPVLMALKRSADRKMPSKSLEDIPSATSNKGKIKIPKEELALSAEDVSAVPPQPDKLFSNPEKLKGLSKSVPSFLQEESDDRETDTASESSYTLGRIKKSPSSLTNLSGSSGMASLSSVSGSLMSVYSGDFGNVDVKGNIQFAIDYVEQLNELHVFICQCKDLAVADVKRQRSDPYVKTYLLPEKYKLGKRKTSVKKKTFNPVYNEILRYKIEKDLLKNHHLNISVWHNDTFGRNSFLGEVELDLGTWDWNDKSNKQINWFPLKPRTSAMALELENRGEMKLALKYVPQPTGGKKTLPTGEVHIWVKECHDLPLLRGNSLNSFIKCTILPDTSRKSRQKTRTVAKTTNPVFNHTMVYDGFRPEDLKEACIELTVWDHNKLANHFLGGLRIGLGTGRSYGTTVDWMDSTSDESALWEKMMNLPNTWVEDTLPLRMLMVAKLTK
ncbi:synaptotagmin-like protein 2 isoform X3 [Oxyura jamaicensis]|uniref:synaptotagmin-like protein 2 isoform X3 n=1 Tax=Oxyura jamaicensis TaxID=8884 RepID=UPI0015A5460E|nr:synaptotagmin-like protein 2 isoform X3 [Oxyura jamaicensis]